jgi:hypothetical protein
VYKKLDWDAIFADIDGGMSAADAAVKHGCAEVTIIHKRSARRRAAGMVAALAGVEAASFGEGATSLLVVPPKQDCTPSSREIVLLLKDILACISHGQTQLLDVFGLYIAGEDAKAALMLGGHIGHLESLKPRVNSALMLLLEP